METVQILSFSLRLFQIHLDFINNIPTGLDVYQQ